MTENNNPQKLPSGKNNTRFAHLHTHSHYSLLDGLAKIDDLVSRAKELGMKSLALTDHGNLYGAIEFYKKARAAEIKPILGLEAYVAPGDCRDKNSQLDDKYYHLVLLCKNNAGWQNLIKLVTTAHLEGFYYKPRMDKELLRRHSDGLIALSGCLSGEIAKLLLKQKFEEARKTALEYQEIFGKGNFFLEIGHHPAIKETEKIKADLIRLSKETGIPLAATQDIHYLKPEDNEYHDILLAVQTGNKVGDADRLTLKEDDFSMKSPEQMAEIFKDLPEAIESTVKISEQCEVKLELGKTLLPKFSLPNGENSNSYLRRLVEEKIRGRYNDLTGEINERLEYELGIIEKTGFADYFLIVQDFINWAKERGIVVGPGRGSAAGSLVSYVLGITGIDPIKYNLIFERFLNPDRIQMPDIDIDITDERRDEVFGYLKEKYGENQVAQIITFGTMAARAAVRDVGRALGISYGFCDQLAKLIPFNANIEKALQIKELADLYAANSDAKKILDAAKHLEGVARHASVHACGIVIAAEPLTNYLPLQRAPQDDNTIVTQFEMHSVEDLGLLKMDLLGLKNLTIIEKTIGLIKEQFGQEIDPSNLPEKDAETFKLLQAGNSTGVFQLESAGMRRYLKDLKPTELEDIIAMVALYRPGPIELIPEYVERKHGRKPIHYLHPKLEPVLKNTYGIMIYQEQLMSAARVLAGLTLAEADVLRKAIGKKIRKLLLEQKEKLIKGAEKNGVSKEVAEQFWALVEPFDRYGFNRCLTGDTEIIDARTGIPFQIKDLTTGQKIINQTPTLNDASDLKISAKKVMAVISNGKKPVFKVRTRSGREIRATSNHPFYGIAGWQLLEKLKSGDKIAVPRRLPEPQKPIRLPKHQLATLGYLLAEGNFCHPSGFYFYSKSKEEVADYTHYLEQFDNTTGKIDQSKPATAVYSKRTDIRHPSTAVEWINTSGLQYKKAAQKFFPSFVFGLANDDLSVLIAKMFQGDGYINIKRGDPQIFYASSSKEIARGLQHLLLRFSILSTIHRKKFKYRGGIKIGYTITISRFDNIQNFIKCFKRHLIGEKKAALGWIETNHPIINGSLPEWSARGSKNTVPANLILPLLRTAVADTGLGSASFARNIGISERLFFMDKRRVGYLRETINVVGQSLQNSEVIKHATSDIYWDEIVSIQPDGVEETFDLTIENNHNFIANNIFVHNSHAACYATIAYQTAYLKAHYPIEFMASLLNADSNDVDRIAFVISECQKMGISVLAPDINKSASIFTPENNNIRFGLAAIKNVGQNIVQAIIENRQKNGPFENLTSFLHRVQHKDLNKKSLESLIKGGALDSFGIERNEALLNIDEIIKFNGLLKRQSQSNQIGLFASAFSANPLKLKTVPPATAKEKLTWEKELLGLYVSDHPLNGYKEKFAAAKTRPIKEVLGLPLAASNNKYFNVSGIVTKIQKIVTRAGKPMLFAKIEDLDDTMEVIVFPDTFQQNSAAWQENNVLIITGKMSWRNSEPKLICESVKKL